MIRVQLDLLRHRPVETAFGMAECSHMWTGGSNDIISKRPSLQD
jgi:hypothetical protein